MKTNHLPVPERISVHGGQIAPDVSRRAFFQDIRGVMWYNL